MKDARFYWVAIVIVVAVSALLFSNRSSVDEQAAVEPGLATSAGEDSSTTGAIESASFAAPTPSKTSAQQDTPPPDLTLIEARLDAMQQRRPDRSFDAAEVAAALKRETAWAPAEEVPDNLPLEPEELTDGRQFIELDSLKIETLMPGDDVKVTIDETGQDYVVTMDRVEKHDYDSISWHGHINGADGQLYSVSFTRGKELTVGGLDTPDGHYVLQAHGNNGWIASSGLLFKVDPNVPDAIDPRDHGYVDGGHVDAGHVNDSHTH